MQRRTFIGSVLAALAAPMLPAAELVQAAPSATVWNTATLTALMEKQFACQMGPAYALFNMLDGKVLPTEKITVPHPVYPNLTSEELAPAPEGATRYVYETYACAIEGGSAEEAEARLAKHFYDQFSKLPCGQLVWRVKPSFSSEEVTYYGKTWMTRADIEDGVWKHVGRDGARWNGTTKQVYEKDAELVVPEGVELDPYTGSYKYVEKKTTLHKMRMRLVLPHLYDEEKVALPELFKPEGAFIKKMV